MTEPGAEILDANARDLAAAEADGMAASAIDRLRLTEARIEGMAAGLRQVAALPDPERTRAPFERVECLLARDMRPSSRPPDRCAGCSVI